MTLGYPDKDVPAYDIDMRMNHTAFSHLASSYNSYDSNAKEGEDEMQKDYNLMADTVYNESRNRYVKATLRNLHSGGFADSDGQLHGTRHIH